MVCLRCKLCSLSRQANVHESPLEPNLYASPINFGSLCGRVGAGELPTGRLLRAPSTTSVAPLLPGFLPHYAPYLILVPIRIRPIPRTCPVWTRRARRRDSIRNCKVRSISLSLCYFSSYMSVQPCMLSCPSVRISCTI